MALNDEDNSVYSWIIFELIRVGRALSLPECGKRLRGKIGRKTQVTVLVFEPATNDGGVYAYPFNRQDLTALCVAWSALLAHCIL